MRRTLSLAAVSSIALASAMALSQSNPSAGGATPADAGVAFAPLNAPILFYDGGLPGVVPSNANISGIGSGAQTISGTPTCAPWPGCQRGAVITCAPWPSCGPGSSAPPMVDAGNNGFIVGGGDF